MYDLDDNVELHAWLCDACIRGDHARCDADFACECDRHDEPDSAVGNGNKRTTPSSQPPADVKTTPVQPPVEVK